MKSAQESAVFAEKYLNIRHAYDILSDEDARKEYDDALDHPELHYQYWFIVET